MNRYALPLTRACKVSLMRVGCMPHGPKQVPIFYTYSFIKYWPIFEYSFTITIPQEVCKKQLVEVPPKLKRVATLPCEILMAEN